MSTLRQIYKFPLWALLLLSASAYSELGQEQSVVGTAAPPAIPTGAIPIEEIRSGKVPLGIPSAAESVDRWRRNSIRSYWSRIAPRERPLSDEEIASLTNGRPIARLDRVRVPPDFPATIQLISNQAPTLENSAVGMLLIGTGEENFEPWCTVILTGRDKVLTARHCVTGRSAGDKLKVYFPYEGLRDIETNDEVGDADDADDADNSTNNSPFSLFCENGSPPDCYDKLDDLAVIRLKSAYEILPTGAFDATVGAVVGTNNTVAGFGINDTKLADQGIRREADVWVVQCAPCTPDPSMPIDPTQIIQRELCFTVDISDQKAIRLREIDSGGPMYDAQTGTWNLNGVARGEWDCVTDGNFVEAKYVNLRHAIYSDWLQKTAQDAPAAFPPTSGLMEILVEIPVGMLDAIAVDSYSISVPALASQLIVTMNHEVGTKSEPVNIDVEVKWDAGLGAGLGAGLTAGCERQRGAEVCTVENPPSGAYEITVSRSTVCSAGQTVCTHPRAYQLTALTIQ